MKSPLLQLVLRLTQDSHTLSTIRPTQIINTEKHNYVTHWTNTIKNQHKLECYSALNREYTMASYLSTVTDVKLRKTLTMYRLSEHSLAVETGRRRQIWLSREEENLLPLQSGRDQNRAALPHRVHKIPKHQKPILPQNKENISPI